jgi:SAM-dependent methyltransferase
VKFEAADVLALPPHLRGADLVVEHTLFCAIDPSLRDRYVDAVADVLRPGGRLLALFWLIRTESGPPFGANEAEIRHRFARRFRFAHAERPADSSPLRPHEMLCVLERL